MFTTTLFRPRSLDTLLPSVGYHYCRLKLKNKPTCKIATMNMGNLMKQLKEMMASSKIVSFRKY